MLHMREQNPKPRPNLPELNLLLINRSGICNSLGSTIWGFSLNEQGFDLEALELKGTRQIFKPNPQILAL